MSGKESGDRPVQLDVGPSATLARPSADGFVDLLREHDGALRALVYRMVGDRGVMDDVLQDTYLKAYQALPSFRGEAALGTWLYRIAYHACCDELRRAGRWRPLPLDDAADERDPAPDPADTVALRGDLAAALDALPHEQRAAVLLVDLNGLDYAAAAAVLGVAPGTVGSRVSRARATLRRTLRPTGEST